MANDRVQRRLAAILAADVVGYSRLMGEDETGTRARFNAHLHELIEPLIASLRGRIVKTTGDGLLVEFDSVVNAVQCAVDVQDGMAKRNTDEPENRRLEFRIGVNLGDVIIEGEDIHGDGVNVAARLEGLCAPGEVYISGTVYDQAAGKLEASFDDLGEQAVKNIAKPVRTYRVRTKQNEVDAAQQATVSDSLPLPNKPSIAVLPFDNMSGDPEQEYFSDGISEDIITALSHIRRFFVVARNTTFTYKGQAVNVKEVAEALGVRYLLEGSVRKSGQTVRITAQLIDGATGNHIWAEQYDRELVDIFEVQDEITQTVSGVIEPEIAKVEWERASRKSSEYLDAWACYWRGMAHISRRTSDDYIEARNLFERAISLDPKFGPAYEGIATTVWYGNMSGLPNSDVNDGLRAARRAVEVDDKDAGAHTTLGRMYSLNRDYEAAIAEHEIAIQLNPSSAASHYNLSRALIGNGQGEKAIEHALSAIRLSPHDANIGAFYSSLCLANLSLKRNEEAVRWGRKAIRSPVINWPAYAFLTSALAYLGEIEEAQKVLSALEQKQPGMKTTDLLQRVPSLSQTEFMNYLIGGLTKAGMPQ